MAFEVVVELGWERQDLVEFAVEHGEQLGVGADRG